MKILHFQILTLSCKFLKKLIVYINHITKVIFNVLNQIHKHLKLIHMKRSESGEIYQSSTRQTHKTTNYLEWRNVKFLYQSILIKFSVSLSFCQSFCQSFCVFHSGDFVFKAICNFFLSFRASTRECFSQIKI